MTLSITEYTADNKPTGRYCLVPGIKRDDLPDMLELYGISVKLQNGQIRLPDRDTWFFVYQAPLKQTTEVSIEDLFGGE